MPRLLSSKWIQKKASGSSKDTYWISPHHLSSIERTIQPKCVPGTWYQVPWCQYVSVFNQVLTVLPPVSDWIGGMNFSPPGILQSTVTTVGYICKIGCGRSYKYRGTYDWYMPVSCLNSEINKWMMMYVYCTWRLVPPECNRQYGTTYLGTVSHR